MRAARFCVAVVLSWATWAGAAQLPNLERGRALYENHCQVCHAPKIHQRANRLPLNAAELREIVNNWQEQERLRWSAEEVEDVVHFLRQTRYKF
jgi:mono/diheme cytochrome c family protein